MEYFSVSLYNNVVSRMLLDLSCLFAAWLHLGSWEENIVVMVGNHKTIIKRNPNPIFKALVMDILSVKRASTKT